MGTEQVGQQDDLRQQVMVLWLSNSALDSRVRAWAVYDGWGKISSETGDLPQPPVESGLAALRAGWRLLSAAPLAPPYPGSEYSTSFQKFEFVFERLVPAAGAGIEGIEEPGEAVEPAAPVLGEGGAGRDGLLSTDQVAEFVSRGFLRFDGLIPDEINRVALAEMSGQEELDGAVLPAYPRQRYRSGTRLSECFTESPGVGRMLRLPSVEAIITSLVGPHPFYDHHAVHLREPGPPSQALHGDAIIDTRAAFDIQLMYYPEKVTAAGGGTLLVPGSQFRQINEAEVARYQNVAGELLLEAEAGTILVLHHGMWHCGRRNRTDRSRYMFKVRLNPSVEQVRLWDTSDLDDPEVRERVRRRLSEGQPWYEGPTARLEQVQRAALFRRLSDDPTFQVEYWLGRLENQAQPRLADLLPGHPLAARVVERARGR